MRPRFVTPLLLGIIAATSSSFAAAQTVSNAESSPRDIEQFDVAGVRLGMTPEDARAALRAAGFKIIYEGQDTMTYRASLDSALRKRNPMHQSATHEKRIRYLTVRGLADEKVSVDFMDTELGNRVSEVSLNIDPASVNSAEITRRVMQQYGRPTVASDSLGSAFWCSRNERRCDRGGYSRPMLEYSPDFTGHRLRLTNEQGMRATVSASIEAAVARSNTGQQTTPPLRTSVLPPAIRSAAIATRSKGSGEIAGARIGASNYYIVYLQTQAGCGSGGCRAQIWKMAKGLPEQRASLPVGRLPIFVLPQVDNGMPRLGVSTFDASSNRVALVTVAFDGSDYSQADWDNLLSEKSGEMILMESMLERF